LPGIADRPDAGRPAIADRPNSGTTIGRLVDNRPADIDVNFNVINRSYLIGIGWGHVIGDYQYFYGPTYAYPYDWYYYRHIQYPTYYVTYPYDPIGDCFTEYYFYEDAYYCYVGSDGATGDFVLVPLPPEYLVDIDPAYQYYYGPVYSYEDDWYGYRHISAPALYSAYNYDPFGVCATYYYLYGESYYCFAGG
jgi:hypothetical protein